MIKRIRRFCTISVPGCLLAIKYKPWSRSVQIYKTVHTKVILSQARDSFIDDLRVNSIYFPSIRQVGLDAKSMYGNYETVDLTWCFVVVWGGGSWKNDVFCLILRLGAEWLHDDAGHVNCGMIVGKGVENSIPALTSISYSKICPVCCSIMPYS